MVDFTYLGSILSSDGEVVGEIDCQITRASKACGCLRIPIFLNKILTKRVVYNGSETWTLKASDVRRLTTIHNHYNHYVRTILGVSCFWY